MEAHFAKRKSFHKKGLPFYTCVDDNNWTKEFPNGEIHLVHIDIDLKTFEEKESFIRQLVPATKVATSSTKTHAAKIR